MGQQEGVVSTQTDALSPQERLRAFVDDCQRTMVPDSALGMSRDIAAALAAFERLAQSAGSECPGCREREYMARHYGTASGVLCAVCAFVGKPEGK